MRPTSTQSKQAPLKSAMSNHSKESSSRTTKYRKNVQNSKSSASPSGNNANSLSKVRINIPKPELKVSHYSKNSSHISNSRKTSNDSNNKAAAVYGTSKPSITRSASEVDFTEMHSPAYREAKSKLLPQNSFSTDYVNHISAAETVDPLKYQQTKIEKIPRPSPRVPFVTPQILQPIPQHHHVVDVVPKPPRQAAIDWNVPDQTIGIPITNPTPILDFHSLQTTNDSMLHYPRQTLLLPSHMQIAPTMPAHQKMLLRAKSLHDIHINSPPIIHHPLVSGNIPPSIHSTENYLIKKQIPLDGPPLPLPPKPSRHNANVSSSILSSTTQQNSQSKRENGEKNKVKFSDTVTVAVVPVSLRQEINEVFFQN